MYTKTFTAVAVLAALTLTAVKPNAALASTTGEYKRTMPALIATADGWLDELDTSVAAISAKPELACGAEYQTLVKRGRTITDDLVGTGRGAPRALREAQNRATLGFAEVVEGARQIGKACDGSTLDNGMLIVEQGRAKYTLAIFRVRNFVHGFRRAN